VIFSKSTAAPGNLVDIPEWPIRFRELTDTAITPSIREFYAAGVVSGDTPARQVPFVAVDFETTGLNCREHSIVSIGLVPFSLDRIQCHGCRHWLVRPRREIDPGTIPIHHITHSDLESAPDLGGILDELLGCMAGRIAVVHFRSIERRFLDQALKVRLNEGLEFPVVDTMELEARLHRRPTGFFAWLFARHRVSIRLSDSRMRYNLPLYRPHHAPTDALATAELLQAQFAHWYKPDTPIRELWI